MTFETILLFIDYTFFLLYYVFFTFFNSIAEKLRDWIWFPPRLSAEKLLSWSFRSSSAGEKTHCRKRERARKKKNFLPQCVPLHIRSHSKTPLRYVREENYLAVQRRESEQCGFIFPTTSGLSRWLGGEKERDFLKCTKESSIFQKIFFCLFVSCFDFSCFI